MKNENGGAPERCPILFERPDDEVYTSKEWEQEQCAEPLTLTEDEPGEQLER